MMQTDMDAVNTVAVILVQTHGGRPTKMQAVGTEDGVLIVRNPVTGATTGFPREYVYVYEHDLYERIAEAHREGSRKILSALWEGARPYSA